MDNGGSYIGFTTEALGTLKRDECVAKIREGIAEAGDDPSKVNAIEVYGSNEVAAWVELYPSIALWLAELGQQRNLAGFQTLADWGRRPDFVATVYVPDEVPRFSVGGKEALEGDDTGDNKLTAGQAKQRIVEHLAEPGVAVRLVGSSGLGKSRFVQHALSDASALLSAVANATAVFCDFRAVASSLQSVVETMANSGRPVLVVVDECPREEAARLGEIVAKTGSFVRLLTIDTDNQTIEGAAWLNLSVSPSSDELIDGIIEQHMPLAEAEQKATVRRMSGGYPRFAILASTRGGETNALLLSAEDIVNRVLRGSSVNSLSEVRALECLSLFDRVGVDEQQAPELDAVAEILARQPGDEMYEHLVKASHHDLVGRRGRYMSSQPPPVATHLALRRLMVLRLTTIESFLDAAPEELILSMLTRWRTFDTFQPAVVIANRLLGPEGRFGSRVSLFSGFGAKCLNALVHLSPDAAAYTLRRVLSPLDQEELQKLGEGRHQVVEALRKLVFRHQTFSLAARLVLQLAAAEQGKYGNAAKELFIQLFQLQLSGTEVEPAERFVVLDEGLQSSDGEVVALCIDALERVFTTHFMRFGDAGEIGSRPRLQDWRPKLWGEVHDFYRTGLRKLLETRKRLPEAADRCEEIVAKNSRTLLNSAIYSEVIEFIRSVAKEKSVWYEAINGVGDWLYFDRSDGDQERALAVRHLYDELMPIDIIHLAILYTKFWSGDIRNPDVKYSQGDKDFGYSERKAREMAQRISKDAALVRRAVDEMVVEDLKTPYAFAEELGKGSEEKREVFRRALKGIEAVEGKSGIAFLRGLLHGIELVDAAAANDLLKEAIASPVFEKKTVQIYTAVTIDEGRVADILSRLRDGSISPADCVFLSYGRGLDDVNPSKLGPLLTEMSNNHGSDGLWAAMEIASMYRHGLGVMDSSFASFVQGMLLSPSLTKDVRNATRDGYVFETLFGSVVEAIGVSDELVSGFCRQVERLCQGETYDVFSDLSDPTRKVLARLAVVSPKLLFDGVAAIYENASALERNRLLELTGPTDEYDEKRYLSAGPLSGVSDEVTLAWADESPAQRSAFLAGISPLLEEAQSGPQWHRTFQALAMRYGMYPLFLRTLRDRIYPTSWSGSIIPSLTAWFGPLAEWSTHDVPAVAVWAREQLRALQSRIAGEKEWERDEGDCPDFGVRAGIMGEKEFPYVPTQRAGDPG